MSRIENRVVWDLSDYAPSLLRGRSCIQTMAGGILWAAIKQGIVRDMRTEPCVDCGKKSTCHDHRNYFRPLDVVPVCHRCNLRRGAAYPFEAGNSSYNGKPVKKRIAKNQASHVHGEFARSMLEATTEPFE
jgi:hypothetical protein